MSIWAAVITALGGLASTLIGSHSNKNRQDDSNEFAAEQAQLNRDFQSRQLEIARQWEEDFYNQYQSPKAMMSQYKDAGVNPIMAVGAQAATPPPGGSAAGSAASPVAPAYDNVTGIISSLAGLAKLRSEVKNIDADTENKKAQAILAGSYVDVNNSVAALNKQNLSKVNAEINLMQKQAKTEDAKRDLYIIQSALNSAQAKQINFSNAVSEKFKEVTGVEADSKTISLLILSASNILQNVVGGTFNIIQKFLPQQKSLKIIKK